MPSYNRLEMFRFMAQLLHPKAVVDTCYFPAPQIFWDRLVQLGSSQLVLPAIHGALRRKKLIGYTPKDLVSYLQEITDLNKKRNIAILKQIDFLSKVLNKNDIDHVFLKGAAMLITKPYDTISERMVGDIDILVSENDLFKAQHLLMNLGFKQMSNEFNFTEGIFPQNHNRHLKRIIHPNHIAALEIHHRLLDKKNNLIKTNNVLKNKVQSADGHFIPLKHHLWKHAILNWQYNDNGKALNVLSFRSVTDVLYLESIHIITKLKIAPKSIKHFYNLLSLYYVNYKTYYLQKKLAYKWKLQLTFLYKLNSFFRKLIGIVSIIFFRLFLFLSSKTYRDRVVSNPKLLIQKILNFWINN